MKNLLLIPILLLIALSPQIINEVNADHITGVSDKWYVKELDNTIGNCEDFDYSSNEGMRTYITAGGECIFFKSFTNAQLHLKEIERTGANSRTGSSPVYHWQKIYDGAYDASSTTDFPENGYLIKGAGQLYSSGGTTSPTNPFTPDLSSGTETDVTLWLHFNEDNGSGVTEMYSSGVKIADLGTFTFPKIFSGTGEDQWAVVSNQTGSFDDYYTVLSYNPSIPDAVSDLGASAVNGTAITISWTDAVNQASSIQQPDIDGYHLFYQNGTNSNSDSYYWTYLTSVAQGTGTYTANIFEDGHTYSFKALTYGFDLLSIDSNIVSETTTGTAGSTQTMHTIKSTYGDDGITDNSFFSRDHEWKGDFGAVKSVGTCSLNSLSTGAGSGGWLVGISGGGAGTCYGHVKSFPQSLVHNVEWSLDASWHRSTADLYHYVYIVDGDYTTNDLTDSTYWEPKSNEEFAYSDGTYFNGAGILYSSGGTTTPSATFTPDLSSATLTDITFMTSYEDGTGADDVYGELRTLTIDGKYNFRFPTTANGDHGINSVISGTEHDVSRVIAYGGPSPLTSVAGVRDDSVVDFTYVVPSWDGGRDFFGLQVYRQCTSDSNYVDYGVYADYDGTWTDSFYARTFTGNTFSAEPDYYWDFDTTGTPAFDDAGTIVIDVDTGNSRIDADPRADFSNDILRTASSITMGTSWRMDMDVENALLSNYATNGLFIGVNQFQNSNVGIDNSDFIGIEFRQTTDDHIIYFNWKDSTTNHRTAFNYNMVEGEEIFVSIFRNSTTNAGATLYSDEARQNPIETVQDTLSGTITNSYPVVSNYEITATEGDEQYYIDNWRIWLGSPAMTYTPSYTSTTAEDCNYKFAPVNLFYAGLNSTAVSISSSSNEPTFTEIGPHSATINWTASGESDVTGYALQYSFDDVTWISLNSNTTPDVSTNYGISGIDYNTTVYVRWADVIGGVVQTYSASGSFTTLQAQAGGGGNVPSSKTTIAPEDLTPEFIPPEPKRGLTALDIFNANVERIAPGETKKAVLEITWEGDTNLRVEEIIVDETTGLKFAFTQPIEFPPSSSGMTTSKIPYVIEAPLDLCTEQQTPKCVYNDATYELPTQVFAYSNGESIKFDSALTINVTDDFNFGMQEIFLGILALVGATLLLRRKSGQPNRRKSMGRKRRPNLG